MGNLKNYKVKLHNIKEFYTFETVEAESLEEAIELAESSFFYEEDLDDLSGGITTKVAEVYEDE